MAVSFELVQEVITLPMVQPGRMNDRRWSNCDRSPAKKNSIDELCRLRDEYAYESGPFDVTAMRAMRERQVRHLVTAGPSMPNSARVDWSILNILIQGLQIDHGAQNPALRLTNLRDAMSALHECRNSF